MLFSACIAALIAALSQLALHAFTRLYAPNTARIPRYVAGILAIGLPFSGLLAYWQEWRILGIFWMIVLVSGFVVICAYRIGEFVDLHRDGQDALERERHAQAHRPD